MRSLFTQPYVYVKMLSMYPAVTDAEFNEASKILEHAYATSCEETDWIEVKRTTQEFSIQQRRTLLHAPRTSEREVVTDEEQEEGDLDEIEQEDEVISTFFLSCISYKLLSRSRFNVIFLDHCKISS